MSRVRKLKMNPLLLESKKPVVMKKIDVVHRGKVIIIKYYLKDVNRDVLTASYC